MMKNLTGKGKINLKVLVIIVVVAAVLGGGLFAARHIRRRIIAARALEDGRVAFDRRDWETAAKRLRVYLQYNPNDAEILRQWGQASLAIEPLEPANIQAAIAANRQLINVDAGDLEPYPLLAKLYSAIGDLSSLSYISNQWLEQQPENPQAIVWSARAAIGLRREAEARRRLAALLDQLDAERADGKDLQPAHAEACGLLALIETNEEDLPAAMRWVERALAYDPSAAEARVWRARLRRLLLPATADQTQRQEALAAIGDDLKVATDQAGTYPEVGLRAMGEYIELGELDTAEALLTELDRIRPEVLKEHFVDLELWEVARCGLAAQLVFRRTSSLVAAAEDLEATDAAQAEWRRRAVTLADTVIQNIRQRSRRYRVLSDVARLYLVAGEVDKARTALDEYRELATLLEVTGESLDMINLVEAYLTLAEGKPYRTIALAEPMSIGASVRPLVWQVLAAAYDQTNQPSRSVHALAEYQRLRQSAAPIPQPQDRDMLIRLVRGYLAEGDFQGAEAVARRAQVLDAPGKADFAVLALEAGARAALRLHPTERATRLQEISRALPPLREAEPRRVDIRVLQASLLLQQAQPDQAEEQLIQAIAECDDPLPAELMLAALLARTGREDEAVAVWREACRKHPREPAAWLALSQGLYAAGDADAAREVLAEGVQAMTTESQRRELRLQLARLDLLTDNRQAGLEAIREMAAADSESVRPRAMLLTQPEIRSDPDEAQRIIDEIQRIQGEVGLDWRLHQAELWLAQGDWRDRRTEIVDLLRHCLNANPAWSAPALLLSTVHEREGDLRQAEDVCRRVLAADPTAVAVADRLIALLLREKRFAEATTVLGQLSGSVAELAPRRLALAIDVGDTDRAVDQLRLRAAGNPQDIGARLLLARLMYAETGDAAGALQILDEADAVGGPTLASVAARAAIVRDAEGPEAGRAVLDEYVRAVDSYAAYLLRAGFLQREGLYDLAEQDFLHAAPLQDDGAGYNALAAFYAETGRPAEAFEALRKGMEAGPDDPGLQRLLTTLLYANRPEDREEIDGILTQLETSLGENSFVLRARATYLLNDPAGPQVDKARPLLERAIDLEPTAVLGYTGLAAAAFHQGDLDYARQVLTRGLGVNPGEPRLLAARMQVEMARRDWDASRAAATALLARDPENVGACQVLVQAALAMRRPDVLNEARRAVETALGRRPDSEPLQIAYARILATQGEVEQAMAALEHYVQTDAGSSSAAALLALAGLHRATGQLDEAEANVDKAAALNPDAPNVLSERMLNLAARRDFAKVAALADDLMAKSIEAPGAYGVAGSILAGSDRPADRDKAKALFERALQLAPGYVPARMALATLAYHEGDIDGSEALYRELLATDPDNPQALNDLAWILATRRQHYDEALVLADRGIALDPENRNLRDTRGVILSHLPGRMQDAIRDFEACIPLARPDSREHAKALLQAARASVETGDAQRARRHLDAARQLQARQPQYTPQEMEEIDALLSQSG